MTFKLTRGQNVRKIGSRPKSGTFIKETLFRPLPIRFYLKIPLESTSWILLLFWRSSILIWLSHNRIDRMQSLALKFTSNDSVMMLKHTKHKNMLGWGCAYFFWQPKMSRYTKYSCPNSHLLVYHLDYNLWVINLLEDLCLDICDHIRWSKLSKKWF